MCGVGAIDELENSKVNPSGAAVATDRAAMVPLAPSRFSMTNDCLRSVASCCAMVRACRSGPEPAAKPTRMRTGPAGYCCADAGRARAANERARSMRSIVLSSGYCGRWRSVADAVGAGRMVFHGSFDGFLSGILDL